MSIQKIAVIGSGVMGSGIAAQIANAGLPVLLLDIVPKDAKDKSVLAKHAIEKMLKTDPAPLMHKRNAKLIEAGNLEDDLPKLSDVDWVIEVVLEDVKVKHDLYKKITAHLKKDAIISSNTSTIPLQKLSEGQSADFQKNFLITHFFNPPRYMRLLELVVGEKTDANVAKTIHEFCDVKLGKGVVKCHDRPGFIANRIGTFWIQAAVNAAFEMGISIEDADAVMGRPIGVPKTGVFALVDLVGVDLMPHLAKSLLDTLPADDGYCKIYKHHPMIDTMIKDGYTGRKGKGGFFRLNTDSGKRVKEVRNLKTGDYHPAQDSKLSSVYESKKGGMRSLLEHDDIGGRYAWAVLSQTFEYVLGLVPEIADDIDAVDRAMKLGYNWKFGPFEMIDQVGAKWLCDRLKKDNRKIPTLLEQLGDGTFYKTENGQLNFFGTDGKYHPVKRDDGVLLLEDIKRAGTPIAKNGSASLWDIGDGVLCLEFHSKMNAIDQDIFALIQKSIALIGDGKAGNFKALVIHNEGSNFSVGANLGLAMFVINIGLWPQLHEFVAGGQATYKALKFAPFPVVGAPSGMALGGGCEILLHCDAVQAHAETYTGLVEVGVGIIPGWGGCKEMLIRHAHNPKGAKGPMPPAVQSFQTIGTATVAKSAYEAFDHLYFLPKRDGVTMNRDRLLADAKKKALELAKDYQPPEQKTVRLAGATAKAAMDLAVGDLRASGKATPHDVVVASRLATVLSGGKTDHTQELNEDQLLKLELEEFMQLVRHPDTIARIEYMLENGKPLRN